MKHIITTILFLKILDLAILYSLDNIFKDTSLLKYLVIIYNFILELKCFPINKIVPQLMRYYFTSTFLVSKTGFTSFRVYFNTFLFKISFFVFINS